jgi:hypothetical protein
MHYLTSINTHGEVIASISGNTETVYQLAPHTNAILVLRQEPPKNSYWDFATESWVGAPPKPSEHHVFNYTTKQWEDPRTLADLKAAQWDMIKRSRSQAEYAGFSWDGSVFDSDAISQQRISGAVTLAQMSPDFVIDWTLADNSVRALIRAEMVAVGIALGMHVQMQFAKAQGLRLQIEAASTPEQVAAVVW